LDSLLAELQTEKAENELLWQKRYEEATEIIQKQQYQMRAQESKLETSFKIIQVLEASLLG
jgi:hypothetical protein